MLCVKCEKDTNYVIRTRYKLCNSCLEEKMQVADKRSADLKPVYVGLFEVTMILIIDHPLIEWDKVCIYLEAGAPGVYSTILPQTLSGGSMIEHMQEHPYGMQWAYTMFGIGSNDPRMVHLQFAATPEEQASRDKQNGILTQKLLKAGVRQLSELTSLQRAQLEVEFQA